MWHGELPSFSIIHLISLPLPESNSKTSDGARRTTYQQADRTTLRLKKRQAQPEGRSGVDHPVC